MSKGEYSINHTDELYNRFFNLAVNRFKWDGLPNGLNSRILESFLIKNGKVMFHKNKENGLIMGLPCFGVSDLNIYYEPTQYNVIGNNYNEMIDTDLGVVIRNNATGTGDTNDLLLFAERINEVEQTMDINLFQQNTPYIIKCEEKERLTFKNILKQVKEFKYAIFGSKALSLNSMEILPTNTPFLLTELQDHKTELMNELLTFLGINNANTDKRERLVVDEVNANNDFILVNIDHMYEERKKACEEINKMFGLNVTVEKREVDNGNLYIDDKTNSGE